MKKFLTILSAFVFSFCLHGQSSYVKIGGIAKTKNINIVEGFQDLGLHVGLSKKISENIFLDLNAGGFSDRFNLGIQSNGRPTSDFQFEYKSRYIESFLLFQIFKPQSFLSSLKGGFGFIGSLNTNSYTETIDFNAGFIQSNSLKHFLFEVGLILDYRHPITSNIMIFGNCAWLKSINPSAPIPINYIDESGSLSGNLIPVQKSGYSWTAGFAFGF